MLFQAFLVIGAFSFHTEDKNIKEYLELEMFRFFPLVMHFTRTNNFHKNTNTHLNISDLTI